MYFLLIITIILFLLFNSFSSKEPFLSENIDFSSIETDISNPNFIYMTPHYNEIKVTNSLLGITNNIKTGYYNYNHNYLVLLSNNKIYKYDLDTKKLNTSIPLHKYFKDIGKYNIRNIDCLFYLNNLIYIFNKKYILVYDLDKNKTIKISDNNDIFEKIPKNIDYCYINYKDICQYKPLPYIYVIKNNNKYKYEYVSPIKFKLITNINETTPIILNETKTIKCNSTGLYRLILIGAGNISGGKGGLIFNDIKLKKNDTLKCIVGKQGDRIPVKENNNSLSKIPYTGSCSGAGATLFYKNNTLLMVAGGGGGWCSEIIRSPNSCNSLSFFKSKINKSNIFFPIKKMIIKSRLSKIIIKKLDILVNNFESINIIVNEDPKYDSLKLKNKKYKYETNYSNKDCNIEINFDQILIDYTIKLDFDVLSINKNDHVDSSVTIIDEQNREYNINNFNDTFNDIITDNTLINYFSNNTLPKIETNNNFVKNGDSISKNNTSDSIKNVPTHLFYLKGGKSGEKGQGGDVISNKYNNLNCCGGGGGYIGGQGISLNEHLKETQYPLEYVGGSGGSSYIKTLTIKNNDFLKDQFINNYNSKNGLIIINKISL